MIQLTKNLSLHEYIPKSLYEKWAGVKDNYLLNCLDPRLVKADQFLRRRFGAITINNWMEGGPRNWSGIRTPDSPYYSKYSQHSWGRASDKVFKDATADEVRSDIKKNYMKLYYLLGLTCIEENVSWVHSDHRYLLGSDELLIVYPK